MDGGLHVCTVTWCFDTLARYLKAKAGHYVASAESSCGFTTYI